MEMKRKWHPRFRRREPTDMLHTGRLALCSLLLWFLIAYLKAG